MSTRNEPCSKVHFSEYDRSAETVPPNPANFEIPSTRGILQVAYSACIRATLVESAEIDQKRERLVRASLTAEKTQF